MAWPGGTSRLCRRRGANMDGRRAEFEAACWRGPAVLQSFGAGTAPTWTAAGRNSRRPVGVARRYFKPLPAARRQHGRPTGGIQGGLLAWPGGTSRFCRRAGANMDGRRVAGSAQAAEMSQTIGAPRATLYPRCPAHPRLPVGAITKVRSALVPRAPHCHSAHAKGPPGVPGGPALAHLLAYLHTCVPANLHTCVLSICTLYPISRSSRSASHALPQPTSSPRWLPHLRCRLSESQ